MTMQKGSLDGLEAAQALIKESSAEWKTLSSSDKQVRPF